LTSVRFIKSTLDIAVVIIIFFCDLTILYLVLIDLFSTSFLQYGGYLFFGVAALTNAQIQFPIPRGIPIRARTPVKLRRREVMTRTIWMIP
ncbi:MAG: hypothetical protein AAFY76_25510, partial [Cyanobacteria bacterium J06649_11]